MTCDTRHPPQNYAQAVRTFIYLTFSPPPCPTFAKARLLQEQEELLKFEALRDKLEEAKRAADYRKELNLVHKMAVRRELQKQQEELKMDMDMIEKMNQEIAAEKQQMSDDKTRLKEELDT